MFGLTFMLDHKKTISITRLMDTFILLQAVSLSISCLLCNWYETQGLTCMLVFAIFSAVLGMFQFGFNTGVINAPQEVSVYHLIFSSSFPSQSVTYTHQM